MHIHKTNTVVVLASFHRCHFSATLLTGCSD